MADRKIAQDAGFQLEILKAVFHDVAYADNADKLAVFPTAAAGSNSPGWMISTPSAPRHPGSSGIVTAQSRREQARRLLCQPVKIWSTAIDRNLAPPMPAFSPGNMPEASRIIEAGGSAQHTQTAFEP